MGSRCEGRAITGRRLAPLNFGPPLDPHGYVISDLRLAVPGHDDTLTSTNLRSSKLMDQELLSVRISPPRERALGE